MPGLGTIINVLAIVLGGVCGLLFGRFIGERCQQTLCRACGVCVLFIGLAGALEGMLTVSGTSVKSGGAILIIGCIAPGALIGELLNIEGLFERFGEWLKVRAYPETIHAHPACIFSAVPRCFGLKGTKPSRAKAPCPEKNLPRKLHVGNFGISSKTGSDRDRGFVAGFVNASLTVCIGAMAVVGAIEDGLLGDCSVLVTKAVLDFIIVMVMTCSMGRGCVFSAIPVGIFQGAITALSGLVRPLMTDAALANLSMIGSILIFCVGVNLLWEKRIRVANLLPAIVLAVAAAFLPF